MTHTAPNLALSPSHRVAGHDGDGSLGKPKRRSRIAALARLHRFNNALIFRRGISRLHRRPAFGRVRHRGALLREEAAKLVLRIAQDRARLPAAGEPFKLKSRVILELSSALGFPLP